MKDNRTRKNQPDNGKKRRRVSDLFNRIFGKKTKPIEEEAMDIAFEPEAEGSGESTVESKVENDVAEGNWDEDGGGKDIVVEFFKRRDQMSNTAKKEENKDASEDFDDFPDDDFILTEAEDDTAELPIKPEFYSSVGEWMEKCRAANIPFPLPLAHAVSSVEKELGLKWPDSFYFLKENGYVIVVPGGGLIVDMHWPKLLEGKSKNKA